MISAGIQTRALQMSGHVLGGFPVKRDVNDGGPHFGVLRAFCQEIEPLARGGGDNVEMKVGTMER